MRKPAPKMKKWAKDLWLDALRSGQYTQGDGNLFRRDWINHRLEYCCLGVLADELNVLEKDLWKELGCITYKDRYGNFEDTSGDLPDWVLKWVNLDTATMMLLINMNDGQREFDGAPMDFDDIADYIEEYL